MGGSGSRNEPRLPRSVARLVLWIGAIGTVVGVGAQLTGLFGSSGERAITQAFSNSCDETIWVAVRYQALDEQWVTRGWWEMAPGENSVTELKTRNRYFYFFAEGEESEWNGDDEADSEHFTVLDWEFIQLGDEPIEGDGRKSVSFFQRKSGSDWQTFTQDFSCGS